MKDNGSLITINIAWCHLVGKVVLYPKWREKPHHQILDGTLSRLIDEGVNIKNNMIVSP